MPRVSNEKLLAILIGLPSIYLYLSGIGQFFSAFSIIKIFIYPVVYLFGLVAYKRTINKKKNFIFVLCVSFIIIFSILMNENIAKYLIDTSSIQTIVISDLLLLYLIAFPAFFIAKEIFNFELLLKQLYTIGYVIVILFSTTFFLLTFVYKVSFDYMNITYGSIPWVFFVSGYSIYNKKRVASIISFVSIAFIMISGCRGAAVTTFLFGILLYISAVKNKFTAKKLVVLLLAIVIGVVIIINLDTIISNMYYSLKEIGFNSRTLELYLGLGYEKSLNHYSDRAVLQIPLIEKFNLLGHGIYSDRILLDGVYAHNVLIEWIYDFGFLFGGLICFYFVRRIAKKFNILFKTKRGSLRIILAACIAVMLCKYMVSSSYLHSPEFWFLFGLLVNNKMYLENTLEKRK